ncbi:unnamed protein product [Strongylus vulgaris]|uniref:GRF-type domain-containing protein n=1 Tax=Strongylus vulgaris TaxID=40348 RepID=A0A3P7LTB1_STRVU|nr:unnamed protein product [Strongylus vulgaris]
MDPGTSSTATRPSRGRGSRGRPRGSRVDSRGNRSASTNLSTDVSNTAPRVCVCGINAVQRTVLKEGPNKGKKFWCCSKPMGQPDKCNFFEWVV